MNIIDDYTELDETEPSPDLAPDCAYCGRRSLLVTGVDLYPHREDLAEKLFYRCKPCDAHVGCHPGTATPLGRLANAELRAVRAATHAVFDPMWRGGRMTRKAAYNWLARKLNISNNKCHMALFDLETCHKVIQICRARDFEVVG